MSPGHAPLFATTTGARRPDGSIIGGCADDAEGAAVAGVTSSASGTEIGIGLSRSHARRTTAVMKTKRIERRGDAPTLESVHAANRIATSWTSAPPQPGQP